MLRFIIVACALSSLSASAGAQQVSEPASQHFHWRPAKEDGTSRPWAILLPGASGLDISGDDQHYFRTAAWLNAQGIDALVVHYQPASRLLPDTQDGKPGPRIARVVRHAVDFNRYLGRLSERCNGIVIGWSLGGEGMWEIASEGEAAMPGLVGAIGYYPSVRGQRRDYQPMVPILVLQGEADRVTRASRLERFVSSSAHPDRIEVRTFVNARHGFDVVSLSAPQMNGKLAFEPAAAREAADALTVFLEQLDLRCRTGPELEHRYP